MALEFKLPELGENIESGDVISIPVAVGDAVSYMRMVKQALDPDNIMNPGKIVEV